nr:non-ribosomal peptide synthetase [Gemmatimonadales bacterium]
SLAHALAHCDAPVAFVAEAHADLCRAALRRAGRDVRLIVSDPGRGLREPAGEASTSVFAEFSGEQEASLYYTSGTTGLPKGVLLSHRGLLAGAEELARAHELTPGDRSLCMLPLYHLNALVATLLPALLSGGSVVLPPRFNPTAFWEDVARYGCTWSGLVPTLVSRLLLSHGTGAGSGLRFARCSSAPLETTQQQAFEERFAVPLIEAMGMTEAGATIFSQPLPPAERKPGSVGVPLGLQVRVVDGDGRELPAGCPGEILIRGASVMLGYHKDPAATAAIQDADGWLHSGDRGYGDEDGHFFITGRLKELIVKAGENVAPREIELALSRHPAVEEAAAVGVADLHLGQDIVAYVVLRPGALVAERELQVLCTREIGSFKTPTEIYLVDALPRGPSGKLQRFRLAQRKAPAPIPPISSPPVERAVAASWLAVLGVEHVGPDDNFFALGGQSLLATQMIMRLRQELGVNLPLSAVFEAPTVSQLSVRVLRQLLQVEGER